MNSRLSRPALAGRLLKEKGAALYIVLATVFIVVALANIILNVVLSQSRFTHHQVSRIQASYAAKAGMVYALEQLRTGNWDDKTCKGPKGCSLPDDTNLPHTIDSVKIVTIPVDEPGCENAPAGINCCIQVTADYTKIL